MYYEHLILDNGFFPDPADMQEALEGRLVGNVYGSVYDRGVIAVYPSLVKREEVIDAIRFVLHVAERVYKKKEPYKYRIKHYKR